MRAYRPLLVIVALAAPVGPALAQADGEMLPRSLVQTVLGFQSIPTLGAYGVPAGDPIIAASAPQSITQRFGTPPNSRILGSVTWLRDVDVFGTASGTIAGVREWFASDFTKRGYQAVDEHTRNASNGGFRDPAPSRFAGYCVGNELLTVDARPLGLDRVAYRVRTSLQSSTCSSGGGQAMQVYMGSNALPLLENPMNASRYMGGGMGCQSRMYGGGSGTSADLLSAMTPLELIQHYEKQLPGAGWARVNAPSDASSVWTKKDSTGSEQTLMLTATASRDVSNCRNVQMMLYNAQRRDR